MKPPGSWGRRAEGAESKASHRGQRANSLRHTHPQLLDRCRADAGSVSRSQWATSSLPNDESETESEPKRANEGVGPHHESPDSPARTLVVRALAEHLVSSDDGVVEAVVAQPLVRLDPRVGE